VGVAATEQFTIENSDVKTITPAKACIGLAIYETFTILSIFSSDKY
jgi:hypothetical protein